MVILSGYPPTSIFFSVRPLPAGPLLDALGLRSLRIRISFLEENEALCGLKVEIPSDLHGVLLLILRPTPPNDPAFCGASSAGNVSGC